MRSWDSTRLDGECLDPRRRWATLTTSARAGPGTKPASSPRVPERSPEKDTLEHFERFCFTLRLPDDGGPLKLQGFQLEKLEPYFAGITETLWLEPSGQGKSTLLGALCLHHGTYVRSNCNVFILGGLGGHGRNTLDPAAAFIDESEDLSRWWVAQEYGMGRIKSLVDRGRITVSSAGRRTGGRGGSSQEGKDPTLIVVEEPHRHEDNGAAVRTLTSKLQKRSTGRHRVRVVHASTAGDNLDSMLGRMVKRATDESAGCVVETARRPDEYYRRGTDPDGDLVVCEWAVPDHIQPPGREATRAELMAYLAEVKKANPADFVTVDNLRIMWKASSSEPWVFLRQNANQWVVQDLAAIDRGMWARLGNSALMIPNGTEGVVVGADFASKIDSTALVPAWREGPGSCVHLAGAVFLKPDTKVQQGETPRLVDLHRAIDVLLGMAQAWPGLRVAMDLSGGGAYIAEELTRAGLDVIGHGQGVEFDVASMLVGELVDQAALKHDANPELTAQVTRTVARRTAGGTRWRGEKPQDGGQIDGFDAAAFAVNIVVNHPVAASVRPSFEWMD